MIGGLFGVFALLGGVYIAMERPDWAMEAIYSCARSMQSCFEKLITCCSDIYARCADVMSDATTSSERESEYSRL